MRFVFDNPADRGRRRPKNHAADVEIVFDEEGPLAGLKLVGLALWRQTNGELSVTLPARKLEGGKGRDFWFDLLRAEDGPDAQERIQRFKAAVLAAYDTHLAQARDRRAS